MLYFLIEFKRSDFERIMSNTVIFDNFDAALDYGDKCYSDYVILHRGEIVFCGRYRVSTGKQSAQFIK